MILFGNCLYLNASKPNAPLLFWNKKICKNWILCIYDMNLISTCMYLVYVIYYIT